MSQELIYTSAPQGLKPGSHGFCTVVSTKGMAANLAGKLEALSAFRHVYAPQEDQPDLNPVVWSHLKLVVGGWSCHVLSRIASAGFDYSKRSNKLAHHVVLDQVELVPAGPAAVLSAHEFMLTSWDGRTGVLPAGRRPPHMECVPAICEAWKAVTGDAGWGGALAEAALAPGNRPATIIFRPGIELLPLFYEALALLPPERRWQVSFSTYFTKLPPGIECQWRGVLAGSPEAHAVRRVPNSLIIDLSRPLGRADESRLVEAGRTGILRVVGRPPMVSGGLRGTLNDQNASETANDDYGELLRLIDQPSEHVTPSFGVKQTTSDVSEIDIGPPPRNALVPTSSTHTEDPSCQQRSSWAIPAGVLVTAIFLISIATAAYYCAAHFGFSSFATAVKTDIRPEENAQRDFSPARDQGETSVADLKIRPDVDIEVSDNKQEGLSPERKDQSHPEQTDDSASHKPTNDAASLTGIINKADGGKNEPLIQQDSKLSRETPPTVIEVPPENPFASFAPNEYYVLPIPEFQVPGGFQKHGQTTASIQFSHIPSPQSIEVDLIGTKHIEPPIACHFKWEEAENAWTLIAEDGKDGARAIASLKPFENNLTFVWKAVKGNQEQLNQLCNLILKFTDRRYPEYTCVLRLRKPELVEPLRFDAMGLPSMKSERTISVRRPLRAAPAVAFGEVTGLPDGTRKATNAATYDFTTHNDEMSQSFIAKLQFQGKKSWIDAVELTLEYKGVIGPLNNLHKKVKVLSTVPINTAKVNKITKELQGDAKGYSEKRASASLALANAEAARLLDNVASLKADINNLDRDLTWISKCQEELGKLGNVVTQLEDENTLIHYRGFYQIDGYEVIIFQSDASIKKSPKKSQLPRK